MGVTWGGSGRLLNLHRRGIGESLGFWLIPIVSSWPVGQETEAKKK